jgi:hypothetical protein
VAVQYIESNDDFDSLTYHFLGHLLKNGRHGLRNWMLIVAKLANFGITAILISQVYRQSQFIPGRTVRLSTMAQTCLLVFSVIHKSKL